MYVFLMSFVAAAFSRQVQWWVLRCEQSMSRECTSRGESEHVWGSRKEERGVKWIMAPLTRGFVMRSELVKRKKAVIERPGVSKAKLASESPEFLMRLLGLEWFISHPSEEIVNFWFTLFLYYFFVLFCKAYLFPPLKECTRHTDDVLGNAWSLDVRICLLGGFLVGMS